jgi:hypothetical protein
LPTLNDHTTESFNQNDGVLIQTDSQGDVLLTLVGGSTFQADLNYDRVVNIPDLSIFLVNQGAVDSNVDVDGDGFNGIGDLPWFENQWLAQGTPLVDLDLDDSECTGGLDYTALFEGSAVDIQDQADAGFLNSELGQIESLVVTLTNPLDGADEVLTADTTGTGITAGYVFNAPSPGDPDGSGVLTLSGTDSIVNYTTVLRTIQYDNAAPAPDTTDRVIEFVATNLDNADPDVGQPQQGPAAYATVTFPDAGGTGGGGGAGEAGAMAALLSPAAPTADVGGGAAGAPADGPSATGVDGLLGDAADQDAAVGGAGGQSEDLLALLAFDQSGNDKDAEDENEALAYLLGAGPDFLDGAP